MKHFSSIVILTVAGISARADGPGVTATEVTIGTVSIESGKFADNAAEASALAGYFDDINAKGGIHGRKIKLIRLDSEGLAPKAIDAAKKLVESENVFATVGSMGTAPHQAYYKYLAEKGIPDMFFYDASKFYETTIKTAYPGTVSYKEDGAKMADFLAKQMKGKKVCALTTDNDSAEYYWEGALAELEKQNGMFKPEEKFQIQPRVKIDRLAVNTNVEVLKLKQLNCDFIFTAMSPGQLAQSANFGFDQAFKPIWASWSLATRNSVLALLRDGIRDNIRGATAIMLDGAWDKSNKVWPKITDFQQRHGIKGEAGIMLFGYYVAETFAHVLEKAGKDLTREKFLTAAEGLKGWKCSICLLPFESSATNHWPWDKTGLKIAISKNGKLVPAD